MRRLLNISRTRAKKSLGQNFISDNNFLLKMNTYIESSINNVIIEIGPGKGALTQHLLKKKIKKLFLIEKDNDLAIQLKSRYEKIKNIYIINDDALSFDYSIFKNIEEKVIIYGNLPFNISTKLLTIWISDNEWPSFFDKMILMFQKEVADRIVAKTGSSKRSRISLISELYTNPKLVLNVSSGSFIPKPKVNSALIYFEILKKPRYKINPNRFKIIIDAAFNQKRKMIRSSLKNIFPNIKSALQTVGIEETKRPQSIDLKYFCDLSLIEQSKTIDIK